MRVKVITKGNASPTLERLLKLFKGKSRVVAGFPKSKADETEIDKAIWNEFGTEHIPERPFMRNTAAANKGKYKKQMTSAAKAIVKGRLMPKVALDRLGHEVVGDIQEEIVNLSSPANAPSTIKRKRGSSNPLVDNGDMHAAVVHELRK